MDPAMTTTIKPGGPVQTFSPRQRAIMLGEQLTNGSHSRRDLCPKCNGGASAEASFIVSRDTTGRCRWRCFRGSCGFKGASGGTVGSVPGTKPEEQSTNPLQSPLRALSASEEAEYEEEYGYARSPLLRFEPSSGRYAHKVLGFDGLHLGWHLRRYSWQDLGDIGRGPIVDRASNFAQVGTRPFIAHFKVGADPRVVVVEDCASGDKLRQIGISSVALLGTVLNLDRCYDILAGGGSNIIMALDRGTRDLELRYKSAFSFLFESWTTWVLDVDLKSEHVERILSSYGAGKTDFISDK